LNLRYVGSQNNYTRPEDISVRSRARDTLARVIAALKKIQEEFKSIIYWVGLGVALVAYAHSNFATSSELKEIKEEVRWHASKDDIKRLERKIDGLTKYLLDRK